ncbi:hypothetical protein UlMin_002614 [Ulmus minor]
MTIPPRYSPKRETSSNSVCRLHKSLYGLKQVLRQWYVKFSNTLLDNNFKQSAKNYSLFIKKSGNTFLALLVYVDDVIIASNCVKDVHDLKYTLERKFKLKDLGNLRFFLRLEVARTNKGILIAQRHYALQLLSDAGYLACKPINMPMEANLKLSLKEGELIKNPSSYKRMIGKLLYLTITRPDISFSVNKLSQFLANPRVPHLKAAQRVL